MVRRSFVCLAFLALSMLTAASAQMVDVSLDYIVPGGWKHITKPNINIVSPDGATTIALGFDAQHNPAKELVATMGYPLLQQLHSQKLISESEFSIADQAGWRMEFEGKLSRKAEVYRFTIICVKRQDAYGLVLVSAPVATYENYRAGIDKVINSVRVIIGDETPSVTPTATPAAPAVTPAAVQTDYSSNQLGMKITLQPGWKLKNEAPGQYSGTPKSTFVPENGTAMVALSTADNSIQHKDHVKDVLHNMRAQSKSLEKLGEKEVTLAGLPATRLDLLTETSEHARIRRVVYIVSRGGRHYLAAAAAVDNEYDQFASVMQKMLESVQLISR